MMHYRRFCMAVFVLITCALVLPAAPPTAAQSSVQILCYRPNPNTIIDCDNLSAAAAQQDPPWTVRVVTGAEVGRFAFGDFALVAISRFSADTLANDVKRIADYVQGGGKLLLLDPDLAALLDPTLAAPTEITRISRPSELTRAGVFTPAIADLTPDNLPPAGTSIVPIASLGEAWIPQTRAGFGDLSSTTLASAVLGSGRVTLAPTGLINAELAAKLAEWLCCIVIPTGPDMQVDAIEVTQAIQDLNNSVDLVAGKRTYVRVHVSSPTPRSGITATLVGRRGTTLLSPTLTPINPGGTITVKTNPNRGLVNDSFLFELPASWVSGTGNLQLTARLDPANTVNDLLQANNTRIATVNLLPGPTMRLRLYNVRYTVSGTTYQASNFHLNALESWLRRAYPIANLQVTRVNYTYPSAGLPNVDTLNSNMSMARLLAIIFTGLSPQTFYYGIVDDGGGFMRGKALGIPGAVSSGPTGTPSGSFAWDTDGSYGDWYGGHEIAHSLGRFHAEFCGAGGGDTFPYPSGRISPALTGNTAIYGFDITNRVVYPPDWKDVMTYCNNQWVSDFTYEGMRQRFAAIGAASLASTAPQQEPGDYLLINGRIELATGVGELGEIHVLTGNGVLTTVPGDWSIVLLNGTTELASYPFTPARVEDDEDPSEPALFAEMVPWQEGTTRIELRNGATVVDQRSVSTTAPTVTITAPTGGPLPAGEVTVRWTGNDADGDSLTYALLYTNDNGDTWTSIATGISASELTLDRALLPGGDNSRFRVIATDGVRSGQADSELLSVPQKVPTLTVVEPADGAVFFPNQPISFSATAYDLEDGELAGAAITWASDQPDGDLGSGNQLVLANLSTGVHNITVTATDSDGASVSVLRTITIADATTPLSSTLAVAPDGISVIADFADSAQTLSVSTSSVGDGGELNWSAQSNADWVRIRVGAGESGANATGSTPNNLLVTIDPAGLPVGSYTAMITFTVGSTTSTLPVHLIVDGNKLFVPLIRR
jgi:hypothetical protein